MLLLTFNPRQSKAQRAASEAAALADNREKRIAVLLYEAAALAEDNGTPALPYGTANTYANLSDEETIVLAYILRKVCAGPWNLPTVLRTLDDIERAQIGGAR